LDVGEKYGAHSIKRPEEISGVEATFESGSLHALEVIESDGGKIGVVEIEL